MSEVNCFDYIIGLSRTECECYPEVDSTTSQSGLYLDEYIPLSRFSSLLNCEIGDDLWVMLDRLRDQAIRTFISDANAMMLKYFKQRREPFTGGIGRAKRKKVIDGLTIGRYYGMRMYCADIVGGLCVINKIGGIFDQDANVIVTIYNNLNEEIDTITIPAEANKHILVDVDLELPMHSNYIENLEYYFLYQYAGVKPYDNDIKCNCGSWRPYFNTISPYFGGKSEAAYAWNKYAMVGGYSGDLDLMNAQVSAPNRLYGLTLDVTFKCNTSEVLCKDFLDFDTNPLANAMAFAIIYKGCELAHMRFINSTNLNREVLINGETDKDDAKLYSRKYVELMQYIIQNINYKVNDCFDCKDFISITKSGILA